MLALPKVNPLYEKVPASKFVLSDVLEKLGKEGFTGYLHHNAPGYESHCIYARGKLICAVSRDTGRIKTGFEAIVQMFDKALGVGGVIYVYQLTLDITACTYALTAGTLLYDGDEVRQVDIKAILARLKMQNLTGTVHFYTPDRFALIFYREGTPVGFYHDGSTEIESSPDESRRVAALPGARITVSSTKPVDELMQYDLLQMVNIEKLWQSALQRQAAVSAVKTNASPLSDDGTLTVLVEDLAEVASAYLAKAGRDLVIQLIREGGGVSLLANESARSRFLQQLETSGRTIDPDARIDEMIDLIKSEVAGRLA
ncbi:MAG TPA: GTPase-activating protein [Desulfuromonadales bacterium]|nr:GTPase-activating protein [Desulfuromonadales bacterium]